MLYWPTSFNHIQSNLHENNRLNNLRFSGVAEQTWRPIFQNKYFFYWWPVFSDQNNFILKIIFMETVKSDAGGIGLVNAVISIEIIL